MLRLAVTGRRAEGPVNFDGVVLKTIITRNLEFEYNLKCMLHILQYINCEYLFLPLSNVSQRKS